MPVPLPVPTSAASFGLALPPAQRLAHDNAAFLIDGMDLKDALGQIKADGGDLHGGWLLSRVVAATASLPGVRMPSTGAGAIHMG